MSLPFVVFISNSLFVFFCVYHCFYVLDLTFGWFLGKKETKFMNECRTVTCTGWVWQNNSHTFYYVPPPDLHSSKRPRPDRVTIGWLQLQPNFSFRLARIHLMFWKICHQRLKCPLYKKLCIHGHTKGFCLQKICP